MKKLLIVIIIAAVVYIAINVLKDENQNLTDNTQNSLSNVVDSTGSDNTQTNTSNNEKVENNNIQNDVVENNIVENENAIENEVQNEVQDEVQDELQENITSVENNKVPDNSYVGEEENSKNDYDTELDGENKAIVLVKKHLGDKASNYTFNVETITSSAYVVRAMDENSSNTYFSVNFTTWVVSEI